MTDANGRPISLFMTAGRVSDYTGAVFLLDGLPKALWLLGDRGYDADWFRAAWEAKGITPCILSRKSRTEPIRYEKRRYKSQKPHRDHVRAAQRLAARGHPLRSMPDRLPVRHRTRGHRALLAWSPEPSAVVVRCGSGVLDQQRCALVRPKRPSNCWLS